MVGGARARSKSVVAVLVGVDGILEGEVYPIRAGENRIGRLSGLEVTVPKSDDQISREHAVILCQDGAFGIKPLKENNPTVVNGEVVVEGAPLSDGDEISLGRSTFRLKVV